MGKQRNLRRNTDAKSEKARRRIIPFAVVVAMAVVIAVVLGFLWFRSGQPGVSVPTSPTAELKGTSLPAAAVDAGSGFEKRKGKGLRPDGGYVIEVKSISDGGKMEASYFNPRPINVHKAEASRDGTTTKVFIELRDTNYPGSSYNLTSKTEVNSLTVEKRLRGFWRVSRI